MHDRVTPANVFDVARKAATGLRVTAGVTKDDVFSDVCFYILTRCQGYTVGAAIKYARLRHYATRRRPAQSLANEPAGRDERAVCDARLEAERLLTAISGREREIIEHRYWGGLTCWEVGRRMGLTRERVRQLEHRALNMMRYASRRSLA